MAAEKGRITPSAAASPSGPGGVLDPPIGPRLRRCWTWSQPRRGTPLVPRGGARDFGPNGRAQSLVVDLHGRSPFPYPPHPPCWPWRQNPRSPEGDRLAHRHCGSGARGGRHTGCRREAGIPDLPGHRCSTRRRGTSHEWCPPNSRSACCRTGTRGGRRDGGVGRSSDRRGSVQVRTRHPGGDPNLRSAMRRRKYRRGPRDQRSPDEQRGPRNQRDRGGPRNQRDRGGPWDQRRQRDRGGPCDQRSRRDPGGVWRQRRRVPRSQR